jgi:hypothetical protein
MSTGLIIEHTDCSICGEIYDECDHVAGRAYMGRICSQVVRGIREVTEVSIVEHPADKRCRVFNFTDNGIKRDLMTWRIMPSDPPKEDTEVGLKIAGYAARTDSNREYDK